jgi:hypothetical protein
MRTLLLALGAAATALAAPALAQGRGQGHGNDRGQQAAERGKGGGDRGGRGQGRVERGPDHARPDHGNRGAAPVQRGESRGRDVADQRRGPPARIEGVRAEAANDRRFARRAERRRGPIERRAVLVTDRGSLVRLRRPPGVGLIRGCPPGLARQNTGCLPPGHARRLLAERPWYGSWWRYPGAGLYRYDGGYLYRLQPDGVVAGFIPLAGGALWLGRPWPVSYRFEPLPDYYRDYYGYDDPYDYRYADGIVYGLDPETETVRQIAALLTGDDWAIGSRMPIGYDVYNVPYAYRDEYYDTPDAWYRYSDGYVYRVDPTTQLIDAAIRLIA